MNDKEDFIVLKFKAEIMESEYEWRDVGSAEAQFSIPKEFVSQLDPGNIFLALLQSAEIHYDAKMAEKALKNENTEKEEDEDV